MKHLVSLDDWDLGNYKDFFNLVTSFKLGDIYCPNKNLILCNLFYEPSTRTSSSFASAMWRIGGQVISINDVNYSSVSKGENLEDTIITMGNYCDIIALRSKNAGDAKKPQR